ncbi:hypothetical protein J6590_049999 [Homalodisca vitripennis]|nr:hypothetical protein J6590_049999 [Homalodisca vitripennis]
MTTLTTHFLYCILVFLVALILAPSFNHSIAGRGLPLHRHTSLRRSFTLTVTSRSPQTSTGLTETDHTVLQRIHYTEHQPEAFLHLDCDTRSPQTSTGLTETDHTVLQRIATHRHTSLRRSFTLTVTTRSPQTSTGLTETDHTVLQRIATTPTHQPEAFLHLDCDIPGLPLHRHTSLRRSFTLTVTTRSPQTSTGLTETDHTVLQRIVTTPKHQPEAFLHLDCDNPGLPLHRHTSLRRSFTLTVKSRSPQTSTGLTETDHTVLHGIITTPTHLRMLRGSR